MSAPITTAPLAIDVGDDALIVTWDEQWIDRLALDVLRANCTCAACTELRRTGEVVWPRPGAPEQLRVEGAELIGAWGVSLLWNDRHETGIYTWDLLRSLANAR